jgi:hypothetical protein
MDGRARWRRRRPRVAPEAADGLLGLGVVAAQLLPLALRVNQGPATPFTSRTPWPWPWSCSRASR